MSLGHVNDISHPPPALSGSEVVSSGIYQPSTGSTVTSRGMLGSRPVTTGTTVVDSSCSRAVKKAMSKLRY